MITTCMAHRNERTQSRDHLFCRHFLLLGSAERGRPGKRSRNPVVGGPAGEHIQEHQDPRMITRFIGCGSCPTFLSVFHPWLRNFFSVPLRRPLAFHSNFQLRPMLHWRNNDAAAPCERQEGLLGNPRCVRLFICPSPGESRSSERRSGGIPAARSSSLSSASLATGRRPLCQAGRPSRDLGFLLVSPLELWLCFRPSAPAVSDLSSCDSMALLRFQIGFVWRFLGRRHVVREALPDAIALSRLACRVRTFVGQDSDSCRSSSPQ